MLWTTTIRYILKCKPNPLNRSGFKTSDHAQVQGVGRRKTLHTSKYVSISRGPARLAESLWCNFDTTYKVLTQFRQIVFILLSNGFRLNWQAKIRALFWPILIEIYVVLTTQPTRHASRAGLHSTQCSGKANQAHRALHTIDSVRLISSRLKPIWSIFMALLPSSAAVDQFSSSAAWKRFQNPIWQNAGPLYVQQQHIIRSKVWFRAS